MGRSHHLALIGAITFALTACGVRPAFDVATEDAQLAMVASDVDRAQLESNILRDIPHAARRRGNLLLLRLFGGRMVVLRDTSACHNSDIATNARVLDCHTFRLVACLPSRHSFVVQESLYGASIILLIDDRTGRRTSLNGLPHYSPNNR